MLLCLFFLKIFKQTDITLLRKLPITPTGFWFSHEGEIQMVNHTTKEVCLCKFYPPPSSFFANKESLHNRVACILRDSNMMAKYVIKGCYFEELSHFRVLNPQKVKSIEETLSKLNLGPKTLLWKKRLSSNFKVFCQFQLVIKIIFFQIY
jgi:hypothetical protein